MANLKKVKRSHGDSSTRSRNSRTHSLTRSAQDLQDWRTKLDNQVKTYRTELGDLRTTLNQEVEQLRTEFQGLRSTLNQQLEATANLASVEDEAGGEAKE